MCPMKTKEDDLDSKHQRLQTRLKEMGRVLIAFSGGVDSTLLLKVAKDVLGDDVVAVTALSETTPRHERLDADRLAKELAAEEGPVRQSPDELQAFKQFSMCINCMLCYASCPVVANEPEFLGPAAIALGHRYNMDSRDEGADERNDIFRGEGTVFSCSYANECSEVCPKSVDPAAAVNQAKFNAVIDWAAGLVLPRGGKE